LSVTKVEYQDTKDDGRDLEGHRRL
jgi:hypothetical protein